MSPRVMERIKVSVDDGYAKWAPSYDAYSNGVIMLEEPFVRDLLKDVRKSACSTLHVERVVTRSGSPRPARR
jgi:hypothetical protein